MMRMMMTVQAREAATGADSTEVHERGMALALTPTSALTVTRTLTPTNTLTPALTRTLTLRPASLFSTTRAIWLMLWEGSGHDFARRRHCAVWAPQCQVQGSGVMAMKMPTAM